MWTYVVAYDNVPELSVEPSVLDFGGISEDRLEHALERSLTLTQLSHEKYDLKETNFKAPVGFRVESRQISGLERIKKASQTVWQSRYEIKVSLDPRSRPELGWNRDVISVTLGKRRLLDLPVTWKIRKDVESVPSTINFGTAQVGSGYVDKRIQLCSDSKSDFKILGVDAETTPRSPVSVRVMTPSEQSKNPVSDGLPNSRFIALRLMLPSGTDPGSITGTVTLTLELEGTRQLRIPFVATVVAAQ